jgi:hypothetical protein
MSMRLLTVILYLIISLPATAQEDLTGTWETTGPSANTNYAKICIVRYNNTYIGYTYDEERGFCKCNLQAEYNPNTKKFKGINDGVIEKTPNHSQCRYNLTYMVIDGKEYLNGTISLKSIGFRILSLGISSPISYTRTSNKADTTDYMYARLIHNLPEEQPAEVIAKEEPPMQPQTTPVSVTKDSVLAAVIDPVPKPVIPIAETIIIEKNKRTTDTLSVINTNAKELLIKVMDNGIVDGDTVSILHNGRVIAERISVKATAHEIKIPISNANERQEIVLVAHNLGSVSPNTALILIYTPSRQYRLTASTDLSKNAMIIFQYKE